MKITAIGTYLFHLTNRNLPLVKITTDEGIQGIGEAHSCEPDKATIEVIRDFTPWLIGRDPRDTAALPAVIGVNADRTV
jgi:L-alanine-DL-glutamate epimerase-like enolase superfamily enzyme